MKSKREFIRNFMVEKHKHIFNEGKEKGQMLKLFDDADYEWLDELFFYEVEIIYNEMYKHVMGYDDFIIVDFWCCPHCVYSHYWKEDCSDCEYGKNHGICDEDKKNNYSFIVSNLDGRRIARSMGFENIYKFFKWNKNI